MEPLRNRVNPQEYSSRSKKRMDFKVFWLVNVGVAMPATFVYSEWVGFQRFAERVEGGYRNTSDCNRVINDCSIDERKNLLIVGLVEQTKNSIQATARTSCTMSSCDDNFRECLNKR